MIPGVISTGLESWGTEEHSRQYFRKRLWGSWSMMRAMLLDKASWKRHIMLDKKTGLDPPGIKLRAAQGFDAADFFITGYWIWSKVLENLATIGYDPTNAFTAAYDWRMTYLNYEIRDQYFTRLKNHIEVAKQVTGLKVVLLSHSMGSQVLFYFFHWAEAKGHGNGGPSWVNDHIESWINISGCMLGALKDVPAVLSGEMRDTVQLNAFAVYGLEKFLSRQERAEIFRAMPGISSMLPIGGNAVWGDIDGAPDDKPGQTLSYGSFLNFKQTNNSLSPGNLTVEETLPYLFKNTEQWFIDMIKSSYSQGVAHTKREVEENQLIPKRWMNPLETRLPLAPDMKIFCFYGVNKPTERAYFYREDLESNRSSVMIGIRDCFHACFCSTDFNRRCHSHDTQRLRGSWRRHGRRRRHCEPPLFWLHVQPWVEEHPALQPSQNPRRGVRDASRAGSFQSSRRSKHRRSRRHPRPKQLERSDLESCGRQG